MKPKFYDIIIKIMEEGRKLGGEYVEISKKIFQNCYDHLDELFVEVEDMNGMEIRIIRHNGIEELNHRWSRMHIRRRTGRSRTTLEMEKYGALLAVSDMQDITGKELLDARKLIRTFPQSPLISSDAERPGILKEFIKLIDDEFEDVSDRDVEGWLSYFSAMQ